MITVLIINDLSLGAEFFPCASNHSQATGPFGSLGFPCFDGDTEISRGIVFIIGVMFMIDIEK